MSGHSKWHNIQARKGKQDALRSNLFSKYSKALNVAARQGGGDPEINFSLRLMIDKARAAGMPKDNIERAIKRGTGESSGGAQLEQVLYEAFGPGGVAILIKGNTDNKNRTVQEIKHILSGVGGSLGSSGSVQWMFEQFGYIHISKEQTEKNNRDELELALIDAGAEDIEKDENGDWEIKTKVGNLKKVIDKLKELSIEPKESGLIWSAKEKIQVDSEVSDKLEKLFSALEENDDVEDYYTNAE